MFVIEVFQVCGNFFCFTTAAKKSMSFTFNTIVYPSDIFFLPQIIYHTNGEVKREKGWKKTMSLEILRTVWCAVGIWYCYENGLCNLRLT